MIQRIQSVYLFLVTLIMAIAAFVPVGSFINNDGESFLFKPLGVTTETGIWSTWALFGLLIVSAIIALGVIFLFRNRPLQIRLSIFNSLLMIGYCAVLAFYIYKVNLSLESSFSFKWTICLPLVALILNYLAIRAIGKDEILVRAADRIR